MAVPSSCLRSRDEHGCAVSLRPAGERSKTFYTARSHTKKSRRGFPRRQGLEKGPQKSERGALDQAPRPVSDRICCAVKASRSAIARALRSITEKNQMDRKASGMETMAG